jgi:cytochrome c oxidase assembly protein subunit 15
MAVPDWPTTFGYSLFDYPWQTWLAGPWDLFIEHGHRLLGATVGLLTIGLVVILFIRENRGWVRLLGLAALAAVIGQGVLGGMRVLFNDIGLAQIHACTGPLFLSLCVAIVAVTSDWWRTATRLTVTEAHSITPLCWVVFGLSYAQLVLGSFLRHVPFDMEPRTFRTLAVAHICMAVALLTQVGCLVFRVWKSPSIRSCRGTATWASGIGLLLLAQVALGISTWVVKYNWPTWLPEVESVGTYTVREKSMTQANVVTAHVAVGSLILVSTLWLAIRCSRLLRFEPTRGASGLRDRLGQVEEGSRSASVRMVSQLGGSVLRWQVAWALLGMIGWVAVMMLGAIT